jgi:predicted ester cyclase
MASETAVRSNTEIVREYTQRVFNEHDPGMSSEYFTPEVKWHGGLLGTVEGSESVTEMLRGFIGALPDLHATEQDIVAAGDTVAVRYVVEATHEGNLLGIAPTGRRLRWDAFDIYRLADGMIVEEWAGDDLAAILYQVGAYTPPWLSGNQAENDPGVAS